jgi:hypothetical protein
MVAAGGLVSARPGLEPGWERGRQLASGRTWGDGAAGEGDRKWKWRENGLGPLAGVEIHQFAGSGFTSSPVRVADSSVRGEAWGRAQAWAPIPGVFGAGGEALLPGMPPMYTHRQRHIYIYRWIYTHQVTGWKMVRSSGRSIYISADTVGAHP